MSTHCSSIVTRAITLAAAFFCACMDSTAPPITRGVLCSGADASDDVHFLVYEPNGGEVFRVGDTLKITGCTEATQRPYSLEEAQKEISFDNGSTWLVLNTEIRAGEAGNDFYWEIPRTYLDYHAVSGDFIDKPTISDSCRVRISIYSSNGDPSVDNDISDGVFKIIDRR